ncbi:hypothetical protein [Nonomuraea candida]|uniref:hypothetical protein n=1 Tax=Nonomuraea candida TaxID=359159 RepID=UPI0005B799A0|nr:hypothetical protein [Nonomuraea candida]
MLTRVTSARAAVCGAVLALLGPLGMAYAGPAHAIGQDVICSIDGTNTLAFSPKLRLAEQAVTMTGTGTYPTCVSSDPDITSGTSTIFGQGSLGCLSGSMPATETVTWNTGESSTISYTVTLNLFAGQAAFVVVGTVTAGKFAGDTVTSEGVTLDNPITPLLDCLAPGYGGSTGPTILTFTDLQP